MNKYKELKNRIDNEIQIIEKHKSKLNELKEEIDKIEKKKKNSNTFKLGDGYYYISNAGDIMHDVWDDDKIDFWRFNQGNIFKVEEEAKDKLFQLRVEAKAKEFRKINNCGVTVKDWINVDKVKYYIYYSLINGVTIGLYGIAIEPNKLGHFNSKQMAKSFVEANKKDLLKYFDIEMKLNK